MNWSIPITGAVVTLVIAGVALLIRSRVRAAVAEKEQQIEHERQQANERAEVELRRRVSRRDTAHRLRDGQF